MNELAPALRRRTEAGTLVWTLLPVDTVMYLEARVRGVTLLLVWNPTKHHPDLLLHNASRVLVVDEPEVLGLWVAAFPVAKPAVADPSSDQAIIAGTARMTDIDGA